MPSSQTTPVCFPYARACPLLDVRSPCPPAPPAPRPPSHGAAPPRRHLHSLAHYTLPVPSAPCPSRPVPPCCCDLSRRPSRPASTPLPRPPVRCRARPVPHPPAPYPPSAIPAQPNHLRPLRVDTPDASCPHLATTSSPCTYSLVDMRMRRCISLPYASFCPVAALRWPPSHYALPAPWRCTRSPLLYRVYAAPRTCASTSAPVPASSTGVPLLDADPAAAAGLVPRCRCVSSATAPTDHTSPEFGPN
jgi:hypothetical protein